MAKATKSKADTTKTEARPIGQGKDPLAEGNTLANPTNSEAETHYDVRQRSDDVREAANKIDDQDANERAEQHNAEASTTAPPNSDTSEQDEVAEGRTEEADTPAEEVADPATEPEAPAEPAAEPAANPEPTPEV